MALGLAIAGLLAVFSGGLLLITAGTAVSSPSSADPSCVPSAAWTETIEHPAVVHTETVVVVDQEAWTETIPAVPGQHYSWTGGQRAVDDPPSVSPDDNDPDNPWQRNTTDEPHGKGQGNPATWVDESLHYTASSQGFASWFYYRHPVPERVIEHPAVTHEEQVEVVDQQAWTETIQHPAVVCESTPPPSTPPSTPSTTPATTQPPEVEPTTATAPPSAETEEPVAASESDAPESDAPEVLGEQASAPPAPQVPTVVDAGLAGQPTGQPSGDDWGAALVVGGLLLLTSSGAVAATRRA